MAFLGKLVIHLPHSLTLQLFHLLLLVPNATQQRGHLQLAHHIHEFNERSVLHYPYRPHHIAIADLGIAAALLFLAYLAL